MASLKNTIIDDTGGILLPVGTTAQRPNPAVDGDMRFNTDLGYVEYYYKGFWIDCRSNTGGITHNGLVSYINPGVTACYPGSGTTLTDLSGNANNWTLSASGVTYSANDGGKFTLTTTGTITNAVTLNYSTSNHTVMVASRYSGATKGRILRGISNNWLLGHWSTGNRRHFAEGWVEQSGDGGTDWAVHTAVGDYTNDIWFYYKNGSLVARNSSGSQGPNGLVVNGSEVSDCEVSVILVYNRLLSEKEVFDNTVAIRLRNRI